MHACIGPDNNVFVWNPAIIWIEGKINLIIKPIMGMWFYKITTLLNNLYIYWNYTAESNTACYTLLYLLDTWINVFSQNSRYAREYTMLLLYKLQPSLNFISTRKLMNLPLCSHTNEATFTLSSLLELEGFYCISKDHCKNGGESNHHSTGYYQEIMPEPKHILQ